MKVEPVEEAAAEEVDGETAEGVAMAVCGVDLAVAVSK